MDTRMKRCYPVVLAELVAVETMEGTEQMEESMPVLDLVARGSRQTVVALEAIHRTDQNAPQVVSLEILLVEALVRVLPVSREEQVVLEQQAP